MNEAENELDAELAKLNKQAIEMMVLYWETGRAVAEIIDKELWKLPRGRNGAQLYANFREYAKAKFRRPHSEYEWAAQYSRKVTEEEVRNLPIAEAREVYRLTVRLLVAV